MPSAHGPIFCPKKLQEKVGVKVRFFIGVSQRTWTDFLSQTKHQTYHRIFYRSVIWRTRRGVLSELLCCDNGWRGSSTSRAEWDGYSDGLPLRRERPAAFSLGFFVYDKKSVSCSLGISHNRITIFYPSP